MDPNIFREYDIRGIVGSQLTSETVGRLGLAIGTYLRRKGAGTIAVGYDARASSPIFSEILIRELMATGCSIVDIGRVPTPVLYHTVFTGGVDGGVMITGSHNPPDHNGFKICLGKDALYGEAIREIGETAERLEFLWGPAKMERREVLDAYCSEIISRIDLGGRKIKAVIDAGNGMGGVTAVPIYKALGVDLVELYTDPDPTFPNHHADPTVEENLHDLIKAVRENDADVGIAFDGDGDRLGVVDENGRIIWGDELMVLFSRSVLAEHPGATVIAEVKCSENLFRDIEAHGGHPLMWKAGHSVIKAKMKETGSILGGEMSGHFFFADRFYGFDDAAYAGARLLEILASSGKPLSSLLNDLPRTFSTPELRMPCSDNIKTEVVRRVAEYYSHDRAVNTIDGARIQFEHGWGLVRPSNTQAILVLRFEADSETSLAAIRRDVESIVDKFIGELSRRDH